VEWFNGKAQDSLMSGFTHFAKILVLLALMVLLGGRLARPSKEGCFRG